MYSCMFILNYIHVNPQPSVFECVETCSKLYCINTEKITPDESLMHVYSCSQDGGKN